MGEILSTRDFKNAVFKEIQRFHKDNIPPELLRREYEISLSPNMEYTLKANEEWYTIFSPAPQLDYLMGFDYTVEYLQKEPFMFLKKAKGN